MDLGVWVGSTGSYPEESLVLWDASGVMTRGLKPFSYLPTISSTKRGIHEERLDTSSASSPLRD